MQGMADYKGQQLCKTALSYNGQTYYYYGNEDGSVWFLTDAIGTEQASEDFPMGYAAGNTLMPALTLNHGDFVDFVDEKLVPSTVSDSWDYSGTVPCDLEETPFSEGQGMASGAGLRTCNTGYQIADMGVILIQDVFRSDLPSATYKGNPKAIVGHVYAVQLRDGNYAVLKITAVGADQESVTFQWEKL